MTVKHETLPEGESTEKWAIREPGFAGTIKQLTHCARCGDPLPFKRKDEPRRVAMQPSLHHLCDDCFDALPE